ncbi:hypothetical protein DSO57_1017206 [Entomophthora muscae]|uniref:Uncharacterized protein n=1 Tax=Entomophthora muscae TaxID=34485 RepID=A0ACC2T4S1_9FUNG|nr:hypothetical protein DSO57_1017206 [Entomophthora muscae]
MFDESIATMKRSLVSRCKDSVCIGKLEQGMYLSETEHLMFFVPEMLLLGEEFLPKSRMGKLGLELLDGFIALQQSIPTGLAPESVSFSSSSPLRIQNPHNSLRPELAESLFYAHRFTNDSLYREKCWDLFVGFDRYTRTRFGYAEYRDVTSTKKSANLEGNMPSYFLAETFKYLYLCQAPESVLPLDKFVLNTEAHPFRIPQ